MHYAEEDIAGLVVAHLDHSLQVVLQRLFRLAVGLYQIATALVHHDQVVILVKYIFGVYHSLELKIKW